MKKSSDLNSTWDKINIFPSCLIFFYEIWVKMKCDFSLFDFDFVISVSSTVEQKQSDCVIINWHV